MKVKLSKSDINFLFSSYDYFEQFIRLMKDIKILLADDVKIELEDNKNEPIQS